MQNFECDMQSPTDQADRTGIIGVEAFDAAYGAAFQASDHSVHAVECEQVEDGGAFWRTGRLARTVPIASPSSTAPTHRGTADPHRPGRRREHGPGRFDQVTTGRAAISRPAGPSGCPTTATAGESPGRAAGASSAWRSPPTGIASGARPL